MPVVKPRANGSPDVMKSEQGNSSVDTFVRHAIGKEPFFSLSRTGESPVQWFQLLHALDQQDLSGWPMLSPPKVQMQKCDKCSREFCSPINYRRHIRVHRRSLNVDKESHKYRDLLGAFWDKLSLNEAKDIVSFKDVKLEGVHGSSIMQALTSLIRKPVICALPQLYLRAGSALLDLIQARPSRFPISSQELFSIFDDASEKTFLCAGSADSMQKYVFDGEAGKIGLEMKNLVACTSFLVEQNLVRAWLANKDAEALRCQKLLVEEEEAAQRRQAKLLERKRQKKLRQKEHKAKEQANSEKADLKEVTTDLSDDPLSEEALNTPVASGSCSDAPEKPMDHAPLRVEPFQSSITEEDVYADTQGQNGFCTECSDSGTNLNVERRKVGGCGRQDLVISRWQVPKSHRAGRNGFHASHNSQVLKHESMQRHGAQRGDPRVAPVVHGNKVWTRKPKSENGDENLKSRLQKEPVNQTDKNCEVMIGSIPVTLGNCTTQQPSDSPGEFQERAMASNSGQEKPTKPDSVQGGSNRSMVQLWRPVSRHGTRGPMPAQSGSGNTVEDVIIGEANDREGSAGGCQSGLLDGNANDSANNSDSLVEDSVLLKGLLFSSNAAKDFLVQRWKDAIAADHVKLVLTPQSEPLSYPTNENDSPKVTKSSDSRRRGILSNTENLPDNMMRSESLTAGTTKFKSVTKLEKGVKIKYIPKQRSPN